MVADITTAKVRRKRETEREIERWRRCAWNGDGLGRQRERESRGPKPRPSRRINSLSPSSFFQVELVNLLGWAAQQKLMSFKNQTGDEVCVCV